MGQNSKIQWCDHTWNPWRGCTKVSPGCAHCYAEVSTPVRVARKRGHESWGRGAPRIRAGAATLGEPFKWNKKPWVCDDCGWAFESAEEGWCSQCKGLGTFHRARVFSLSLGDWLDPEVPVGWLATMLDTIRLTPNLDWLLCTKRPELWSSRLRTVLDWSWSTGAPAWGPRSFSHCWIAQWQAQRVPPDNIWILYSAENQATLDERTPNALHIPAVIHGVSAEPLLGPLEFDALSMEGDNPLYDWDGIRLDWVIVGGESGQKARPCNTDWIRSIKDQCAAAKAPCFVKQLGSNPSCDFREIASMWHPKGGDPAEWPEDLRVREFPDKLITKQTYD